MRGNWIAMSATQAAANTNPTSLAAVANLPTWSDVFGTVGSRRVEYEMDDGAGRYECGYGTINLATQVLTRDYPLTTFDATATPKYNANAAARLTSFSAAVTVRCAPLATSDQEGLAFHGATQNMRGLGNGYANCQMDLSNVASLQGWRNFLTFLWTGTRPITSCSIGVATSQPSGKMRVGLMEITAPGVYSLLKEFTENSVFDLSLTGPQTINNFSPILVPPGAYLLQFVPYDANATSIRLTASGNQFSEKGSVLGRSADGRPFNCFLQSAGANTLAASATGTGDAVASYSNPPQIIFGMN